MKGLVALILSLGIGFGAIAVAAPGTGAGGGGDRPGYAPVYYQKDHSACGKGQWYTKWEYAETDRSPQSFYTCENRKVRAANYVANPKNRCKENGKPVPVTVPRPSSDRSDLKWLICKGGKYVIFEP